MADDPRDPWAPVGRLRLSGDGRRPSGGGSRRSVLEHGGAISAVVDNDFVSTGDARFDLVTLAVTNLVVDCPPAVRGRLVAAAFDPLTDRQRDAYVAHLLLRIIDWPIRGNRHDEVEVWLARADELLPA